MVTIRLSRAGAKKRPFYHIVVTDSASPRDGRFIEKIGFYNPVARGNSAELKIDLERVNHWVGYGAQMSQKVKYLAKRAKHNPQEDANQQAQAAAAQASTEASTATSDASESTENASQ